jgi:hypothetical protein
LLFPVLIVLIDNVMHGGLNSFKKYLKVPLMGLKDVGGDGEVLDRGEFTESENLINLFREQPLEVHV